MIRFVQCVRRKQGLTVEDFRRHWKGYQDALMELATASNAYRVSVGFGLKIPHNSAIQEMRGTQEPFDAVLEVWWESGAEVTRLENQPPIAAKLEAIRALQVEFIDLQGSSFFFASEEFDQILD